MSDKTTILCVDDDEDILLVMKTILENAGYECITADTAEEGWEAFEANSPDAVIGDMMMEDIDSGSELAGKIKQNAPDKPLYVLSSIGDNIAQGADSTEVNADGILQKPVDGATMLSILSERLS